MNLPNRSITLALSKGRILNETLPLLASTGIQLTEDHNQSRKLILPTNHPLLNIVVIRATDVPTFVEHGAADLGVAGKDVLMEHGGNGLYELLDLHISRCKLMVARPMDRMACVGRMKIATKFVNITKQYFAEKGRQVDVIKLYGSMELAPLVGLAHGIVDVVDTGNTLRANRLEPSELIAHISSRLVVNKAAFKVKHAAINSLVQGLTNAVEQRGEQVRA